MEKNFYKIAILFIVIILLIIASINYIIDPFFNYHKNDNLKPVIYGEMYQNSGMAKYFEYDTLITGTSMTEGFVQSWFSTKYNCNAIKLPYAGGNMKDFEMLFDNAYSSNNQIKNIFFGLDVYTMLTEYGTTRFEYEKYQISNNPFYDVEYLLNNNILFNYTLQSYIIGTSNSYNYNPDNNYVWEKYSNYGKEIVLESYSRPEINENEDSSYEMFEDENFELNLKSLCYFIENHPETTYYIFFPPYSILYWDSSVRTACVGTHLGALYKATQHLLKYDNVKLYGFIMNEDIITNLDNYKDYTHYKQDINRYMLESFDTSNDEITIENYQQKFEDFEELIYNYNYDKIFQ